MLDAKTYCAFGAHLTSPPKAFGADPPVRIDHVRNRQDTVPMFYSTKRPTILKVAVTASFATALACSPLAFAQEHQHGKEKLEGGSTKTITGEVVDLMCFIDHNSKGEKHAACAAKCIKDGGPVGITSEGKTYLVVGDHKPMNDQLAEYAGKTVTLKGKLVEREGMAMLENAEIVKK